MRVLLRSVPFVLALGAVLPGCYQASDSASKSAALASKEPGAAASVDSSEYVLTVEGMT